MRFIVRFIVLLKQYDKATYRVRYDNTPGSLKYQHVARFDAARSTIRHLGTSCARKNMETLETLFINGGRAVKAWAEYIITRLVRQLFLGI